MTEIKWHHLTNNEDFEDIIKASFLSEQLIYKHSNSCSISNLVKSRMEKEVLSLNFDIPISELDVINQRSLSSEIAEYLNVRHESPQMIVISEGKCIFHTSHFDVSLKKIPVRKEE